jgi:flagellar operon protein
LAKNINNILIPNVTKIGGQKNVDVSNRLPKDGQNVKGTSDFKNLLNEIGNNEQKPIHGGISLSTHAAKRLEERQIDFNGEEYLKVKEAITRLKAKGGKDSLVITDKAAYIVDVANEKVVTAVDKMSMNENVFTKIDSTVFMN